MSTLLASVSLHQQHQHHLQQLQQQQMNTIPPTSSASPSSSLSLSSNRTLRNLAPDFFYYDVDAGVWVKISDDTHKDGGPGLIFDHQMVIDSDNQVIYVFGGKTISAPGGGDHYSGLYRYDIENGTWKLLRDETSTTQPTIELRSRIGHCMLFDHLSKKLFIFAGQRCKDYLCDFYEYSIDSDEVTEISRDSHRMGGPEGGFTQRSTIDPVKGEIYVLSGLMREKNAAVETVKNSFWVYHIASRKWNKIYQNENTGHQYWNTMQNTEPRPRFAHQLVYDTKSKVHYLFGGNPGETDYPHERLDDFWSLQLTRPGSEFVLARAMFILRKQQYNEMCAGGDQLGALAFLRESVATVVPKEDMGQFNSLAMRLFDEKDVSLDQRSQRTLVFEQLLQFFPTHMRPPAEDLMDCID